MRHAAPFIIALLLSATLTVAGCESSEDLPRQVETTDDPVVLTGELETTTARIAEPVRLTWTVSAPPGTAVAFPDIGTTWGEWTITHADRIENVPDGNKRVWFWIWTLESTLSGKQTIPPITVAYETTSGGPLRRGSLASGRLAVSVESAVGLFADPTQIRDVESVVELRWGLWDWTWRLAMLAGLLAVMILMGRRMIRHVLHRRERPERWAMTALDRLEHHGLRGAWDADRYFQELTAIVREYITRRSGRDAHSLTTEELLTTEGGENRFDDIQRASLVEFLRASDLIRFARHDAAPGDARRAINAARDFVRSTATDHNVAREVG